MIEMRRLKNVIIKKFSTFLRVFSDKTFSVEKNVTFSRHSNHYSKTREQKTKYSNNLEHTIFELLNVLAKYLFTASKVVVDI